MPTDSQSHGRFTTGRPLGDDGRPLSGPALELDPDGPAAELLRQCPRPLASSPGTGTWATLLETPAEGASDRPVLLQWLAPDATEPPAHVHPTTERFDGVEGDLTLVVDGEPVELGPEQSLTVEAGVEHTFRNDTDGLVAFTAELPSMLTVRSLYTLWGLDHDGAFDSDGGFGEPGLLHALVISEAVAPETTMAVPAPLQRILWATVGRVARALGYRGIDESYLADSFWEHAVEQPTRGECGASEHQCSAVDDR